MIVFTFQVTGFRSYVDMYVKDKVDEMGNAIHVVHEVVNERWEVCLTMSEKGFQQVSFVNSIATTKVQATVTPCGVYLICALCSKIRLVRISGFNFFFYPSPFLNVLIFIFWAAE